MKRFNVSQKVQWKWMGRFITGSVKEVYLKPTTKTIKGKQITRLGSEENPAYLVESEAGNIALKLQSELTSLQKTKAKTKPSMFGSNKNE